MFLVLSIFHFELFELWSHLTTDHMLLFVIAETLYICDIESHSKMIHVVIWDKRLLQQYIEMNKSIWPKQTDRKK